MTALPCDVRVMAASFLTIDLWELEVFGPVTDAISLCSSGFADEVYDCQLLMLEPGKSAQVLHHLCLHPAVCWASCSLHLEHH